MTELTIKQRTELMALESRAKSRSMDDRYIECKKLGLPAELTTAFTEMSIKTAKTIAGKTMEVGKIVIDKVIDFINENPNMAIGAVIGASVGALSNMIPFIGPVIGPLVTFAGATVGAIAGHRLDKAKKGEDVSKGIMALAGDLITIAKEFFNLLAEIFNTILDKKSIA
jgi:hypothetical protein